MIVLPFYIKISPCSKASKALPCCWHLKLFDYLRTFLICLCFSLIIKKKNLICSLVNCGMTLLLPCQDDDDEGDDDDEDDGFFVPHGYLSDGEGALEDEVDLAKVIVDVTLVVSGLSHSLSVLSKPSFPVL